MIDKIADYLKKPEIYKPGTSVMWTDPHISEFLLATHLNEDIDLASRRSTTRNKTIEWILDKVPSGTLNILDLGCGPGLYTHKLARKGHIVKGIDFSQGSVQYAKSMAEKESHSLEYECMNYLSLNEREKYDLVIMIFTDFGVLVPGDRDILIKKIQRALKPGGVFIFDFLNRSCFDRISSESDSHYTWSYDEGGFWKDLPYLVLNSTFIYGESLVTLSQNLVMDKSNNFDIYRFWMHYFEEEYLKSFSGENGFSDITFYNNVIPGSEFIKESEVGFAVCKKQ